MMNSNKKLSTRDMGRRGSSRGIVLEKVQQSSAHNIAWPKCGEMFSVLIAISVMALFLHTAAAQCPPLREPCRCAPSIYEPVIDSLSILDTAISTLHANAFYEFLILRLVLNRNGLTQLDDLAFNGRLLDSLVELDLGDNLLQQIPQAGLPRLRNLRKLYLSRNKIAQLHSQNFLTYASREILVKLELAGNKLTDQALAGSDVFRPLSSLRELSLEANTLTSVPSQALEEQRQTLLNLNMGLNQIKDVPAGALNFPQLTSLSLEFNGISVILPQAFQTTPHLQYLWLTGNKFSSWQSEMFHFVNDLKILGIGETHTPNLIRLEMSEAAVTTIEPGAFQRTPRIQAVVLNKNRLSQIRSDTFQGFAELYSIDLQGNKLDTVEPYAFAKLPALRHLDISYNQLQTLPMGVFEGSFEPMANDRRVIYACANPWRCDSQLEWFRQLLRENLDIDIDKPGCVAACTLSPNNCPTPGTPLRAPDYCPVSDQPLPLSGAALSMVGWIILAVILTILTISTCLMALIRYGMSHRRKKQKEMEIEDQERIMSSAASQIAYPSQHVSTLHRSFTPSSPIGGIDLDLPVAHTLDDRQNYFI